LAITAGCFPGKNIVVKEILTENAGGKPIDIPLESWRLKDG
jgi:hypothetical protein